MSRLERLADDESYVSRKCAKNHAQTQPPSWDGVQGLPPVSGKPEKVQVARTLSLLRGSSPTTRQSEGAWAHSFLVRTRKQGQALLSIPSSLQGLLSISPLRISHPSTCLPRHAKIQDDKHAENPLFHVGFTKKQSIPHLGESEIKCKWKNWSD